MAPQEGQVMAFVFTIVFIAIVLVVGHFAFKDDEDMKETWRRR